MKNLSNICLALVMLLVVSGCKDYLEEVNYSRVVADEYYTTREGFESLVNATYASMRNVYGNEPWVFSAGTDLYVEGRNRQPEGLSEYRNLGPAEPAVETFYRNVYAAIQTANNALYFSEITAQSDVLEARIGEVKFIRAYYYFLLVQQFGDVAIVKDRINEAVTSFERDPAQDVYAFIISEMEEALDLVPPTAEEQGRVGRAAVLHFLAKVHLTRGYETFGTQADFTMAAEYADAAIQLGSLVNSFEQLFFPGNENNPEVLFSIQYSSASIIDPRDDGHMQNLFFGPYLGGQGAVEGYPYRAFMLVPTLHLFDLYSRYDARFETTFMINVYQRYYDYYERNSDLANLNIATYFAPSWAVQDTAAWRAANPATRAATRIRPYPIGWEAGPNATDGSAPGIRKFDDPKSAFANNGTSTRDIILARLGETFLIAAEAYLKLNQLSTAADRINSVRMRAAKPGAEDQMEIGAGDVDIHFILDERARELAGEYHRWFDLKRTGTLVERTRLYNRDIKAWFDSGINPFEGTGGALKILRPIPQLALDLNNANIQQNPGY